MQAKYDSSLYNALCCCCCYISMNKFHKLYKGHKICSVYKPFSSWAFNFKWPLYLVLMTACMRTARVEANRTMLNKTIRHGSKDYQTVSHWPLFGKSCQLSKSYQLYYLQFLTSWSEKIKNFRVIKVCNNQWWSINRAYWETERLRLVW